MRVDDRTREAELSAELEEQEHQARQRVDLAMEMMQIEPDALTDYLTRFLAEVAQIGRLRTQAVSGSNSTAIHAIFRILHSLKGVAGVIGLRSFAQKLHRTEDAVESLRSSATLESGNLDALDPWLESLRVLGSEAKDLITRLSALATRKPAPATVANVANVVTSGTDLVQTIEQMVAELSSRLGKPARVVASWNHAELPPAYASTVREVLIQLARNSMVHGVEMPQERRQTRKPTSAVLQMALRRHEQQEQLEIIFQDDGRGLDLIRIRARARELFKTSHLDDTAAAQVIFEPGFSTAATVTGDAGRGVGLDLVRDSVEKLGGTVMVHNEPGAYCAFQIVLPLTPAVIS